MKSRELLIIFVGLLSSQIAFAEGVDICSVLKDKDELAYCQNNLKDQPFSIKSASVDGIIKADTLNLELDIYTTNSKSKPLLELLKDDEKLAADAVDQIDDLWSSAIKNNTESPELFLDFNRALEIAHKELVRKGTIARYESLQTDLKKQIKGIDIAKSPNTMQAYVNTMQLLNMFLNPQGSLSTYRENANNYNSDFQKAILLAELESPKTETPKPTPSKSKKHK